MSFLFDPETYKVKKNGVSPFQNMCAYLGGSAFQTVGDNPVTAYRQLVQQYAKGADGKAYFFELAFFLPFFLFLELGGNGFGIVSS